VPADSTVDFVVMFVLIGMVTMGLGSVALGWIVKTYDRVMSRAAQPVTQTAQTDRQTDYVSEADVWLDRLEVDRTKTALIERTSRKAYAKWTTRGRRIRARGCHGIDSSRSWMLVSSHAEFLKMSREACLVRLQ